MQEPPWMPLAWTDLGQSERPGADANPLIARYFRDVGHPHITDDETAWCAAFVGSTLERAGVPSTRSLMARSYLSWGVPASPSSPGAIAVLSRGSNPALGHVGFLVALTPRRVILLGGNQSNAVTVAAFDRARLLGLRLPHAASRPTLAGRAKPAASAAASDDLFDRALALVLRHEGGWSDDPFDPGGATNKGITLAVYAREIGRDITADTIHGLKIELRSIPDDFVRRIYRERYWTPGRTPDLPAPLALFHFDACVNQGVGRAARFLQQALAVNVDGEIGPLTLAAAVAADTRNVLEAYADIRRRHYRSLGHFWRFGRGWLKRVDTTLAASLALVVRPSAPPSPVATSPTPTPKSSPQPKELQPMPSDTTPVALPASPAMPGKGSVPSSPAAQTKWWGQSLTIWGALLTAVTTVAPAIFATLGIDMPADLVRQLGADAITAFQALAGLAGTVMTIAGRVRASTPLEMRRVTVRL